jgi:hypothetical protein
MKNKELFSFIKRCVVEVIIEPTKIKEGTKGKEIRLENFIKKCLVEVITESIHRKKKIYGTPRRLMAFNLVKECILEVLKENLTEGFDPLSQAGPNIPCENPYPAWNSQMAKMEENEHGREAQMAGAGQFDPRTFGNLTENPQENVITKIRKEVYAALEQDGFRRLGDEPQDYMEYYLNGFVTVQISIRYDTNTAYVERYYDSEMTDNIPGHHINRKIPIPPTYDPTFVQNLIKLGKGLKKNAMGDESIFGGIDDITESIRSQSTEIKWKCPHCKQMTNIPVEIESPSDYIACSDCEHCGKEIKDPKLDAKIYDAVINHFAGRADYLRDTLK